MEFAKAFTELKTVEFYNFKTTTCRASVTKSNKFESIYIGINKESNYIDAEGNPKNSWNNILLPLGAAKRLQERLTELIRYADSLQSASKPAAAAAATTSAIVGVDIITPVCHN